ncbi:MAG: hypothetical protein D6768_12035 [Chloroflexi bacterium]|nr:MAG: hypothetical protein D6768_12035 [Chloroflexota bacterium]
MTHENSVALLTQFVKAHLERLVLLREFRKTVDDPYFKSALSFTIEDTQEAIARASSRLRQLGEIATSKISDETSEKLLRQGSTRRTPADKIRFVHKGLVMQMAWYDTYVKALRDDPDTQATLVALAEQARLRLERWENMMDELKVSPDKSV